MNILIKEARIINEGSDFIGSVHIQDDIIKTIYKENDQLPDVDFELDAKGKILIPGVIDDQVHFREPGLTHKGEIYTEAKAAVAGGVTSYMEMPNTNPQSTTQELLQLKYERAAECSLANYSFYMGATNDNLEEVLKTDSKSVCGVKVFMGSSTGNMLVDDKKTLEGIFSECPFLIATHCEDEETIRSNLSRYIQKYGDEIPIEYHPIIRSHEACYISSSMAVELAAKHGARLHVLHISTSKEVSLFEPSDDFQSKRITAEACVHHLSFSDIDYAEKGTFIKWNPAVKSIDDQNAIWEGLLNNRIDVIATDHAPHTIEEKNKVYTKAPSGGPLIQHSLVAMMDHYRSGKITITQLVNKMCHAPARLFNIDKRGFVKEGYFADLVLLEETEWEVYKDNILYKCGWSPFEGRKFNFKVSHTFVNGNLVYDQGEFDETFRGMRLAFNR